MSPEPTLHAVRLAPARLFASVTLRVLGLPLRVESDSARVIDAAREAFGGAEEARPAQRAEARIRIDVRRGGPDDAGPVSHGSPRRQLLILSSPGCRGFADNLLGEAVAEVGEGLLDDAEHFRCGVLEALALFMLARRDRDPLHAAAVVRDGTALLLAGRSGVGKSTLVYAAARSGLQVLSEDAVYLQLNPFRAWGMQRYLHLTPGSVRFFPELEGVRPRLLANGKTKLALDLRTYAPATACTSADRAGVCLLARGPEPGIEPLGIEEVVDALTAAPEPGFDVYAQTVGARVRLAAQRGAWRMTLPPDPADAVPMLHQMLDAVEG
ncbi:MAG: hypothetical protein ACJ8GN_02825 [Longimicrobiaceae bacterium]